MRMISAGRGGHGLVFLGQQAQIAQMLIGILHGQDLPVLFFHLYGSIAHLAAKQKAAARNFGLRLMIFRAGTL